MSFGFVLALGLGVASPAGFELSPSFPDSVPSGPAIADWEHVTGQASLGETVILYEMYVNPLRPALYEITRYRVFPKPRQAAKGTPKLNEVLIWNAHPGERKPLLCFERLSRRGWRRLWPWRRWTWQPREPGSARYRELMLEATRLYMLHRKSLGLGPP